MLSKLLIAAVFIFGALAAFRVFGGAARTRVERARGEAKPAPRPVEDMRQCRACGAWGPANAPCACNDAPTP